MADFLNAPSPEQIVFGHNMTTITLYLSRSLAHRLNPGDTVVVTNLDHDANITPWTLVAQDRGAKIEYVDFDVEDGTLKLDSLEAALEKKPKIVAVGYASNALGTINPVKQITQMAQEVGALVFIDAVQYAPLERRTAATLSAVVLGSLLLFLLAFGVSLHEPFYRRLQSLVRRFLPEKICGAFDRLYESYLTFRRRGAVLIASGGTTCPPHATIGSAMKNAGGRLPAAKLCFHG